MNLRHFTRIARYTILGLIVLIFGVVAGCALLSPTYQKPKITLSRIQWLSGTFAHQHIEVMLLVQNDNGVAIPVDTLSVVLSVDDEMIGSGKQVQSVIIPAHGSASVVVDLTLDLSRALLKVLPKLSDSQHPLHYEANGLLTTHVLWLKELPFDVKGEWTPGH